MDLRLIGQTFNDASDAVSSTIGVTRSIKCLVGGHRGDLSSKLIAAGVACIAFPEPVVSDMIGSMLIAVGISIKRRKGLTATDVFKEAKRIMAEIRKNTVEL